MSKQYETLQIGKPVKQRLRAICKEHHLPLSLVVERLIERLCDGEFSGSLEDVVRDGSRPEPVLPGVIVGESNDPEEQIRTVKYYYGKDKVPAFGRTDVQ
jgi:hypothetical protein